MMIMVIILVTMTMMMKRMHVHHYHHYYYHRHSRLANLGLKTQWNVQYPYLSWLDWYQLLKSKYPSRINAMSPFSGTAFMTTNAVVKERLTKINK